MTEQQFFDLVMKARNDMGIRCKKYSGSIFAEKLKSALAVESIITSPRDVFIERVPVEVDLLLPKPGATPRHGILYRAAEVLAAFELKSHGSYGERMLKNTRRAFELIREQNPDIECAYISLTERQPYKWTATKDNIGATVYMLLPHRGSGKKAQYEPTGDWGRLRGWLKGLVEAVR